MRSNKFKVFVLVIMTTLLLSACAGLLSACNFGGDDTDGDGSGSGDNTLVFMAYSPANEKAKALYTEVFDAFKAETGISVKPIFVQKDQYNTKLTTSFSAKKNKPDVFYLDQPILADFVEECLCLDEGFFAAEGEEGLKKSDFFTAAMDTAVYGGKTYAVPLSLTTSVLLYNKNLVKEVPSNWNEWKSISVPSGVALFNGIGSGGYASWYFQAFLKSAGGELVKNKQAAFNSAEAVKAVQMIVDLYAKSPETVRATANAFTSGKIMFQLAHSTDIVNTYNGNPNWSKDNMGATLFIPEKDGGVSYSNIGGENLAIRKGSGKEEQAKQLVKFLLRKENITKLIGHNFAAIKSIATVPETDPITGAAYPDVVKEALGVVLKQLDTASARPSIKNWQTKVNDAHLANALGAIIDQGEPIQATLDQAVAAAGRVLKFE